MRKTLLVLASLVLLAPACGSRGAERTVLVDFAHDQVVSSMFQNFPNKVSVTPGTTVVFKQSWTGEPHTVTGGTIVNKALEQGAPILDLIDTYTYLQPLIKGMPDPDANPKANLIDAIGLVKRSKIEPQRTEFLDAINGIHKHNKKFPSTTTKGHYAFEQADSIIDPFFEKFFNEKDPLIPPATTRHATLHITQNGGQRCFLASGKPPKDENTPCAKADQKQPVFTGKQSYYNSGVIPYQGAEGNTYKVKLADDIKPGSYFFFCEVHGPDQRTEVVVKPKGTDVPSQDAVSKVAQDEIARAAKPLIDVKRDARDGRIDFQGRQLTGPFAGLPVSGFASVNEFAPATVRAKVGQKVTWKIMGNNHTISFDVPKYLPIFNTSKSGYLSINPKIQRPAGGSPKLPHGKEGQVLKVDGGTYDGTGFWSSGLFGNDPYAEYSVRFAKAGTYKFACLIHPPMVGTVEVR